MDIYRYFCSSSFLYGIHDRYHRMENKVSSRDEVCIFEYWIINEWQSSAENDANDKAVDSLLNYETVKYFSAEEHEINRYKNSLDKYNECAQKSQTSLAVLNVGQSLFISIGQLSVMLLAAQQVGQGLMTVGDFVLVNTYILQLYVPLNFLGTSMSSWFTITEFFKYRL